MSTKLKPLRGIRSHVNDVEEVSLSRNDWKLDILCFVDKVCVWNWLRATIVVLVVRGQIVVDEKWCLIVVEIRESQDGLVVIFEGSSRVVNDHGPSESIFIYQNSAFKE